ncbi:MAG: helix-turn-helix transcriptional regulator [Lachnospiraceae bacterium]|jgi:transcriptional regulator with XRE-family HTH domain|nr:helix-turn-helix transcriptional regulator [uncultured Acetatifactor sp.]MCI9571254.1 helix-turn-helix transcriptional regulator [Lachnospiraceae bacterium]
MDIGKRISFFREAKGYSVNKLATLSGISQSYLRDVELGKKNPTVEILSYLCDALDISLQEFFDTESKKAFSEDPLIKQIYHLTPSQRKSLAAFLDSMITK